MRLLQRLLLTLFLTPMAAPVAMGQGLAIPSRPLTRVLDQAHVLTEPQVTQLEDKLTLLKQTTGVSLIVYVGTSLQGESLETYAAEVFHSWGLGQKGADNGLLYMLFVGEPQGRRSRFATGYGVESVLPDGAMKRIQVDRMREPFSRGDWFNGIMGGVQGVEERLLQAKAKQELPVVGALAPTTGDQALRQLGVLAVMFLLFLPMIIRIARDADAAASGHVPPEERPEPSRDPHDDLVMGAAPGASMSRSHDHEGSRQRTESGGDGSNSSSSSWDGGSSD